MHLKNESGKGIDSVTFERTTGVVPSSVDLCINRNNHQQPIFHPLGDFLNPALALLGQGLKKSPIGQKLDFANHPTGVATRIVDLSSLS
jgi:hypothetical protein